MLRVRLLVVVLAVQLAVCGVLVWAAATHFSAFRSDDKATPVAARADRFDAPAAMDWARRQVALGPRPAGSEASRRAAELLRPALPHERLRSVPGGLRNIVGSLPGRGRPILLIAHYDTTPVPGYLGANNSAAAVGAVIEIARALAREDAGGRAVRFLLTDGEEAPTYPVQGAFETQGLRGSRAAARTMRARYVIVMDFVANKGLRIPREEGSDPGLWDRLLAAARRVGAGWAFPDATRSEVFDDHTPFARRGIPAIDLIDFDYACWQKPCDTLDKLSLRSLDASGETVLELIRELRRS